MIKPHSLIFIYVEIGLIFQLIEHGFITKNISSGSIETMVSNCIIFIGIGFLTKYNFKFASIIFIIPIIIQLDIYYKFLINFRAIRNLYDETIKCINFIFSIVIVYYIFQYPSRKSKD